MIVCDTRDLLVRSATSLNFVQLETITARSCKALGIQPGQHNHQLIFRGRPNTTSVGTGFGPKVCVAFGGLQPPLA